jgi:hypothetical protein
MLGVIVVINFESNEENEMTRRIFNIWAKMTGDLGQKAFFYNFYCSRGAAVAQAV